MSRSEIKAKFSENVKNVYSAEKIEAISDNIFDIDNCNDLNSIFSDIKIWTINLIIQENV